MNNRIRLAGSVAVLATTFAAAPSVSADDSYRETNCVSGAEWHTIQSDRFGTVSHSARRSVFEQAWDVTHIGRRDAYFQAANENYYTLAYRFCGSADVVIVLVYRITSDAWAFAVKGAFVPTRSGEGQ